VKNVGLVYVDARGVTRKALIKGAAKGMLFKAKVGNGDQEVLLGGGKAPMETGQGESQGAELDTTTYSNVSHPGTWAAKDEKKGFFSRKS